MAKVKDGLFYSKDHEWLKIDGNKVRMGISDYAQQSLGDITYIELPASGDDFKAADIVANVESVKAASDIYSPISGTVEDVNVALEDNPELLNSSAFDQGWICDIKTEAQVDTSTLMNAQQYEEYLKSL